MSYQILPNLIFLLAILGILIMILRRLPEAAEAEAGDGGRQAAAKLSGKGLPIMAISKAKSIFRLWLRKIWNFMLEAKDVRHQALAGYRIRKMFGARQAGKPQPAPAAARPASEQEYLEAIKRDPKNLVRYDSLGKFYLEQNQIADARDIYQYLARHDAGNADYHARLAYCHYQLRDYEQTIACYSKSLGLDASQPNRFYNLGLVLELLGRSEEARQAIGQAIALEPGNPRYYISMSNVCLKLGAHDQALNSLQKAHEFDPENEKVAERLQKLRSPQ